MLKYAIIGFGGLGKVHFRAYKEVKEKACTEVKLVALCDIREQMFKEQTATNLGNSDISLDFSDYNIYYDADELLEKEELDFVVTALPTYLHEQMAVKVMKKGIHCFSEKPMAINLEQAENMLKVSKEMGVKLMIGQCCRYNPKYQFLKELVDTKKYGNLLRADFYRLSLTPGGWNNWFQDGSKSGGAALDLHVHDVDLINYIFGQPKSVSSHATNFKTEHDSIVTYYDYDGMVVTATGEWGCPQKYQFSSGLFAKFEQATLEMRSGVMTLVVEGGEREVLDMPKTDDKATEVIDFIDCIVNDKVSAINPAESTFISTKIALAEKQSADSGKIVEF